MENTWPSSGHVSKPVGGGYPTSKPVMFERKGGKEKERYRERKGKGMRELGSFQF